MSELCGTCGRPACGNPDDDVCRVIAERNALTAELKASIDTLTTSIRKLSNAALSGVDFQKPAGRQLVRTVLAISEHARASTMCPACERPAAVRETTVLVHFASPGDTKPCRASFGTVLGGVLFEKGRA